MIGMLAGWLVARNAALTLPHARRIAKAGLIAAAIVTAVIAFLIWDWRDDKAAIRQHETGRAEQALEAERRASSANADRQAAIDAASRATTEELETIHDADPEAAARPAGAGTRAVADRLRSR
jgi:hypothetical protein